MTTIAQSSTPSKGRRIAGIVISVIAILMLAMDAGGKLVAPEIMIAHTPPLGIPADVGLYRLLGGILAICLVLYVIPRTAVLGAVLLTGFLGGAIAINLRADMPLVSNTLFGVYLGLFVWAGLLLRNAELARVLGLSSTQR